MSGVGVDRRGALHRARDLHVWPCFPESIHHGYDTSPGHWSRSPNSCRKGSNSLWEIVFITNTRPDTSLKLKGIEGVPFSAAGQRRQSNTVKPVKEAKAVKSRESGETRRSGQTTRHGGQDRQSSQDSQPRGRCLVHSRKYRNNTAGSRWVGLGHVFQGVGVEGV